MSRMSRVVMTVKVRHRKKVEASRGVYNVRQAAVQQEYTHNTTCMPVWRLEGVLVSR
jgi:hypothetical protein